MTARRLVIVTALFAAASAGCVAVPAGEYEAVEVRTEHRVSPGDLALRADSEERAIREATLRVRARGCFGVGSGSGFAVRDDLLVTNRHVVEGADVVQVTTWDGQSIDVEVSGIAVDNDLAVVQVSGRLPKVLDIHRAPPAGAPITAVGYPEGGPLTLTEGHVVDQVDGRIFDQQAPTIRVTAEIRQGNSGGPVIDEQGRIVGIVYATEIATDYGLVIPVDAFTKTLARAGFLANPSPC